MKFRGEVIAVFRNGGYLDVEMRLLTEREPDYRDPRECSVTIPLSHAVEERYRVGRVVTLDLRLS